MRIPFNKPHLVGTEIEYIQEAHRLGQLSGDGIFTKKCSAWLEDYSGCARALVTHSCTASLEIAAFLCRLQPGDEVIMPSYTFVSTANAFVIRGAVPIFADIRSDTLNIDESRVEDLITEKTRAIVAVHYAGVSCAMDELLRIAQKYSLVVIEDAAQGIFSTYKDKPLGSIGDYGCFSFHETKNIISGEGGALLVRCQENVERAEIIREKGTDRSKFFRKMVDKYTWVDVGSSYLPGEITSAFLWGQLEAGREITQMRRAIWDLYDSELKSLVRDRGYKTPTVPAECAHNAHMYYLLVHTKKERDRLLKRCRERGLGCVFHYVPLHSSPAGKRYGLALSDMSNTERVAETILRLPLWVGINADEVISTLIECISY